MDWEGGGHGDGRQGHGYGRAMEKEGGAKGLGLLRREGLALTARIPVWIADVSLCM